MGYSDEVERPIIKTQHNRPTFETANQFMKTFGTEQSSPIIERKVRARDGPTEVVMEASVKTTDLRVPAPTPPPKPNGRTPRASESDLAESRPHSVLPQSKRPLSPGMGMGDGTPSMIDVDLVGKDRYDPQSKAFSMCLATPWWNISRVLRNKRGGWRNLKAPTDTTTSLIRGPRQKSKTGNRSPWKNRNPRSLTLPRLLR